jgi:vacuolar-type H+-ATPase subunit I/STV1
MPQEPKRAPDWEAIEREYRVGQLSLRELARQHSISDKAIRKRAAAQGWDRDLTEKVNQKVRTALVRTEVRTSNACGPTEREAIEAAAARGVEVVRSHRTLLGRLRRIADTLLGRMEDHLQVASIPDPKERREALSAIGLHLGDRESPADLMEKTSRAIGRLIPLERQAFHLDASTGVDPVGALSPETVDAMRREALAEDVEP